MRHYFQSFKGGKMNKQNDPIEFIRLVVFVLEVPEQTERSLTEPTLMLAVVWLSGEGLLAVADGVPVEAKAGKVMSWMP